MPKNTAEPTVVVGANTGLTYELFSCPKCDVGAEIRDLEIHRTKDNYVVRAQLDCTPGCPDYLVYREYKMFSPRDLYAYRERAIRHAKKSAKKEKKR